MMKTPSIRSGLRGLSTDVRMAVRTMAALVRFLGWLVALLFLALLLTLVPLNIVLWELV